MANTPLQDRSASAAMTRLTQVHVLEAMVVRGMVAQQMLKAGVKYNQQVGHRIEWKVRDILRKRHQGEYARYRLEYEQGEGTKREVRRERGYRSGPRPTNPSVMVDCPTCGSPATYGCVTKTGGRLPYPHVARTRLAAERVADGFNDSARVEGPSTHPSAVRTRAYRARRKQQEQEVS